MTTFQTVVKYCAIALAILLIIAIFCGIIGIVARLSFWLGGSANGIFGDFVGDMRTYTVAQDIDELDIDISATALDIVYADEFRVESNLKHIKVSDSGGCLKISETKHFGVHYDDAAIKLYIPRGTSFAKADISTGAGLVKIEALHTERLSFDIGAGDVEITVLGVTKSADIEGGVGNLVINSGNLTNADIELGVGEVFIQGDFIGNCNIDAGVGNAEIVINGYKKDYSFDVSTGIGNTIIDGQKIIGDSNFGNGENVISLDCGIGQMEVSFAVFREE